MEAVSIISTFQMKRLRFEEIKWCLKVSQLVSGETRIQTQICLTLKPMVCSVTPYSLHKYYLSLTTFCGSSPKSFWNNFTCAVLSGLLIEKKFQYLPPHLIGSSCAAHPSWRHLTNFGTRWPRYKHAWSHVTEPVSATENLNCWSKSLCSHGCS